MQHHSSRAGGRGEKESGLRGWRCANPTRYDESQIDDRRRQEGSGGWRWLDTPNQSSAKKQQANRNSPRPQTPLTPLTWQCWHTCSRRHLHTNSINSSTRQRMVAFDFTHQFHDGSNACVDACVPATCARWLLLHPQAAAASRAEEPRQPLFGFRAGMSLM